MKGYVVSSAKNGTDDINGIYYLITEKGECLASHMCSCKGFALGALYARRKERIEEFTEKFGTFEVDYLGCDDMTVDRIMELNKEFYMNYIKAKYQGSNRAYTFKTTDSVVAGDAVQTADGKHLEVVGIADMEWVQAYGSENIKSVSKVNDSTEQHI